MDDVSSEMTEWRAAEGTPREARFVSELTGASKPRCAPLLAADDHGEKKFQRGAQG